MANHLFNVPPPLVPDPDRHLEPPPEDEDPLADECGFCDGPVNPKYGYLRDGYQCPRCNRIVCYRCRDEGEPPSGETCPSCKLVTP